MPEFILLMHYESTSDDAAWESYLARLRQSGHFQGGSAIGDGLCVRKAGTPPPITNLAGYIRIEADSLDQAKSFLIGNPIYEAGGTVEIRGLPRTD